jgi:hypothetical protein
VLWRVTEIVDEISSSEYAIDHRLSRLRWKLDVTKHKSWPKNGQVLSGAIRRLAPTLRALGVDVIFDRDPNQKRRRIIRLTVTTLQTPSETQTQGDANEPDEREQERF